MTKNKRLGVSICVVILIILMLISIVFTFSISYMFSTEGISGKLFGKYVYIMETEDMKPEIEKGAAVISDADAITVLVEGNVILFKNGDHESVMRIRQVVHNTDDTLYHVSSDASPQDMIEVSKNNVIAKCTTEGKNLGAVISFLSSLPGIILCMILPCGVLVAMLIIFVIMYKKSDDSGKNGAMDFYADPDDDGDDEFKGFNGHNVKPLGSSPLFDPGSDINPGDEFEKKKSSIAQNFARKPGAVSKPVQRKKQPEEPKAAVEKFKAAVEDRPHAPVSRKSTLVPENEHPVRSEQLEAVKNALSNQNQPDEEKTMMFKPVEFPKAENPAKKTRPQVKKEVPKNNRPSNSAVKSNTNAASNKPASKSENINSIDDLIKALEAEKKKL